MPSKHRLTGSTESSTAEAPALPNLEQATAPNVKRLRLVPQPDGPRAPPAGAPARAVEGDAFSMPPASSPPAAREGDWAAMDRDVLLSAIKARLRAAVAEPTAGTMPVAKRREMAARVRASVLDCVTALDRLHRILANEAGRARQRKLDAFDALAAPAQAPAAFAGGDASERRARPTAALDPLALLPNRLSFLDRLHRAFAQAGPQSQAFAVLSLDLDGFEPIQAALGTAAGDELLAIVAARLVRAVRSHDMVSRLRGDEFGLFIATVASREQLRRLTCKLFDAVAAPMAIDRLEVSVRPNIGIAMGGADGASSVALIKNANAALDRARRQQTGYAFFDERGRAWVPGRA